jgi:NAD(P)-dependent dehydrogenase (short-subunit alcohol dehydrogenase family)
MGRTYRTEAMSEKVVVIVGATGGIGRATAQTLAKSGYSLVLAARGQAELELLAQSCKELGVDGVMSIPVDITVKSQVEALFVKAKDHYGQVDVVINSAGMGRLKPIQTLTEEDFDQMIALNLKGTFLVSQAAALAFGTAGGHIFNIPGILGQYPMATAAGYCASKFGVVGLTKSMALDLKRSNVRFTLLYLGGIDSPFWDEAGMKVQRDKMLHPEQVAQAIAFALSLESPAIPTELVIQPESHVFV